MESETNEPKAARSASERATESRANKKAAGYGSKTFLLPPAALADLAALAARDGLSETDAVAAALAVALRPPVASIDALAPAAKAPAPDVVSPAWFEPECWLPKGPGWACSGKARAPQSPAALQALVGTALRVGGGKWTIRKAEASGARVILSVIGTPPGDAVLKAEGWTP